MRRAVRAIIIKDKQLLVMHRNKFGQEYDTLPGGAIEIGEEPLQALAREFREETGVTFTDPKLVVVEHAGDPFGDQMIYLCTYQAGEPKLSPDSEEHSINGMGKNLYQSMWLPLDVLATKPFKSEKLKQTLLSRIDGNWPDQPIEIFA